LAGRSVREPQTEVAVSTMAQARLSRRAITTIPMRFIPILIRRSGVL